MTAMKPLLTQDLALKAVWSAIPVVTPVQPPQQAGLLPDGARSWLAALRLLSGVPFQHIVPDERLLPPESVRFFYVDRAWTDALIQGALAVGAVTDADRALLQKLYPAIRDDLDQAERLVRVTGGEGETGTADALTGMLLRSQAVSGWPGIHVNAYRAEVADTSPQADPSRLHLMRLEQLAPSVLFAIFDGVPEIVHVDEPRHGVQFGVDRFSTVAFSDIVINSHTLAWWKPFAVERYRVESHRQVIQIRPSAIARSGTSFTLSFVHS